MARPSKYEAAFPEQARKLCLLGATDVEIADFFEVNVATLYRWKNEHPEFCEALKEAKAEADKRVEESLYHRALGYSHDAVKIFMPAGATAPVHAPYREHYPPDTTAAIFWLKNRQPAKWRDKQEQTIDGNVRMTIGWKKSTSTLNTTPETSSSDTTTEPSAGPAS